MEVLLNIKEIRNSEMKTNKIIEKRESGIFIKFKTGNQVFDPKLFHNKSVLEMTTEELQLIGEYISKVQELIALLSGKDSYLFILKKIVNSSDRFKVFAKAVNKKAFGKNKEDYNIKVQLYADFLGLNIQTAHAALSNYCKDSSSTFNRMGVINLTDIIFAGITPEEIQIMFGLSQREKNDLVDILYTELDAVSKNNKSFKEWRTVFVNTSEKVTEILNKRIAGDTEVSTLHPLEDYIIDTKQFNIYDTDGAEAWAEMSVKILFYIKMISMMPLESIKEKMTFLVNSKMNVVQQTVIEELGFTEEEFKQQIKESLDSDDNNFFQSIQRKMIASICQINDKTAVFIQEHFIDNKVYEKDFIFEELLDIIFLMRTDLNIECINHMFYMDNEISKSFERLFRNRI